MSDWRNASNWSRHLFVLFELKWRNNFIRLSLALLFCNVQKDAIRWKKKRDIECRFGRGLFYLASFCYVFMYLFFIIIDVPPKDGPIAKPAQTVRKYSASLSSLASYDLASPNSKASKAFFSHFMSPFYLFYFALHLSLIATGWCFFLFITLIWGKGVFSGIYIWLRRNNVT